MITLTQTMFKDKHYQVQLMADEDRYLIAEICPMYPSSSFYSVYIYGHQSEGFDFPFTTQGFKDAVKAFNELIEEVIKLRQGISSSTKANR